VYQSVSISLIDSISLHEVHLVGSLLSIKCLFTLFSHDKKARISHHSNIIFILENILIAKLLNTKVFINNKLVKNNYNELFNISSHFKELQ
jgi:hypothetical protein